MGTCRQLALALAVWLIGPAALADAGGLIDQPVLVLDPGMHVAPDQRHGRGRGGQHGRHRLA